MMCGVMRKLQLYSFQNSKHDIFCIVVEKVTVFLVFISWFNYYPLPILCVKRHRIHYVGRKTYDEAVSLAVWMLYAERVICHAQY